MKAYTTHPEQVREVLALTSGAAHAGQLFVSDFVRMCRSRSQYSHAWGTRCVGCDDNTWTDSCSSSVPRMMLYFRGARISDRVLAGGNV